MEKPGEPPAYNTTIAPGTQPTQYPHPAISPLSTGAEQPPQFVQQQQPQFVQQQQPQYVQQPGFIQQQPTGGFPQHPQQPPGAPPQGQGFPQQSQTIYQQPQPQHGQPIYQQQHPGQPGQPGVPGQPGQPGQQQRPQAGAQPQSMYKTVVPVQALGASPAPIDCPSCHQRGLTNTNTITGDCTHLWALGFCFVTVCFTFVPYLVDSFKDVQHKCGRCGTTVATWKRSGGTQVHVFN